MTMLADVLSTVFERRNPFRRAGRADARPTQALVDALVSTAGEISGRTLGQQILERYDGMTDADRLDFFRHLARDLNLTPLKVRDALDDYEASPGKTSYRKLLEAVEPPRQELVRRLNQVPGATPRLVQMRADLLRLSDGDAELAAFDLDLRHLFSSWFNRGFLVLLPINWESPAAILEKIIAYEAVHAIDSWEDLRRRVEPADRRCFAFFHPAMPDEPLIFVEVALTQGIPGSVQDLLAPDRAPLDPEEADTAVFYSISNCQAGLASISFGNSLIKQVAADLSTEWPTLRTFVTLSPIPGLSRWLSSERIDVTPDESDRLKALAAHYLTQAKRKDGGPLDPVARFHLGNGAVVHAVHAQADTSQNGQKQSLGAMVNYLYDLPKVSENHERFAAQKDVAQSSEIRALAQAGDKEKARSSQDDEPAL